jgi:hypothetical protein
MRRWSVAPEAGGGKEAVADVTRRYGRAQFLKDAAWMGLSPESAFSRAELRRRRDRLMSVHHPDRGGDGDKAARINAIYGRMTLWLDRNKGAELEIDPPETPNVVTSSLKAMFSAGAAQIGVVALVAVAALTAFRGKPKP